MSKLLPPNFDSRVCDAVKYFWSGRLRSNIASQEGGRGSVIGGKNLDGFAEIIQEVAIFCGIPNKNILVTGKSRLTIPGYFRPTKMWDSLVVYKGRLAAAFELKSQVGPSFGNNFNNRSEESIGSATDFWTAHREKAFTISDSTAVFDNSDSKPPFLGYLMLLEECPKSTSRIRLDETHFKVAPEFVDSSYAKRYELLIERLVTEKLYSSACLMLSDKTKDEKDGDFRSPKTTLSPRNLFADFAAALLSAKETY
ncbi:MAG: PaeR7I family type II restriction endonuclease [Pyrinomonadaceae bacterium]